MTNSPMRDLLLALLAVGLLCPTAVAEEGSQHRPDHEEAAGPSSSTDTDTLESALGPPDPNGCRPYCK